MDNNNYSIISISSLFCIIVSVVCCGLYLYLLLKARVAEALLCGPVSSNTKWRILCEETTASTAVSSALEALTLLLDSERVYEDLEYALRGPSGIASKMAEESTNDKVSEEVGTDDESETVSKLQWRMKLVARAWDSRLKPQSEFRGIVWGGTLTCLCQYFHPLLFEELFPLKEQIQADIFEGNFDVNFN